ncbi:MAG: helix-turn-helix transcriptional regulator [Planctomycetota bacterium]
MNAPDLTHVAELLEAAARELRSASGTWGIGLHTLLEPEAECVPESNTPPRDAMPIEKPMLMTAAQVAAEFQIHERTLGRMVAAGEGPKPIKVRGATRFRRTAVEKWVARRES